MGIESSLNVRGKGQLRVDLRLQQLGEAVVRSGSTRPSASWYGRGLVVPAMSSHRRATAAELAYPVNAGTYPAGSARRLLRGNAAHHAVANGVPCPRGI